MAAVKSKISVVPEDNCEDEPPSYHSSTTGVSYTEPGSSAEDTAVTTVRGVGVQQADVRSDEPLSGKYSCAKENVERIIRILFILILIAFAGVTIASLVRISLDNIENSYPYYDNYDDYDDYYYKSLSSRSLFVSINLTIIFYVSLSCTIGLLLCDIPVIILQFVSTRFTNHIAFRILDIIKWILLSIGFIIIFIMVGVLSIPDYLGPVISIFWAFCVIMIMMGIIMTKLDCSYVSVTSSTNSRPRRVATLVPADSTQPIPVTTAV